MYSCKALNFEGVEAFRQLSLVDVNEQCAAWKLDTLGHDGILSDYFYPDVISCLLYHLPFDSRPFASLTVQYVDAWLLSLC